MGRFLILVLTGLMVFGSAVAQGKPPKAESLAKLELTVEVATTDDDGYPSSLRITITNVGGVPVDMPMLKPDCSPDNGFHIETSWSPDDGHLGVGSGYGCGGSGGSGLIYRIQHDWVRLRPGEFMTECERVEWSNYAKDGPGTLEYWAEYFPPSVSGQEVASLLRNGYVIPTETLETRHSSFHLN
jgi:hypothetical protein